MEIIDDLVNQPWFKNKKTLSIYSQGLTQSTDATDKVNALINAHIKVPIIKIVSARKISS
jgi:assimilatory nitrate reductase catalytic subunit